MRYAKTADSPSIYSARFSDREAEASTTNEQKTPVN